MKLLRGSVECSESPDPPHHSRRRLLLAMLADVKPSQAHMIRMMERCVRQLAAFESADEFRVVQMHCARSHFAHRNGSHKDKPRSCFCRAEATGLILRKNKKGRAQSERPLRINPGGDLRSHTVTRAVSSALRGLTSVFGMGTGVTLAV